MDPSYPSETYTLAAKFFTRRIINVEAITRTFKPLWRAEKSISARDIGDNIVLFEFEEKADLERVLLLEPWSYDKYLVAFRHLEEDTEIESLAFDHAVFWVQIENLPILSQRREVAESLGASIGEVLKSTGSDAELGGGKGLRVRVRVNITQPLSRGRKIGMARGREGWVSFKYERLPNFCFWCGVLTHREKDCEYWLRNHERLNKADQGYGPWLKAEQDRPNKKVEVHVEGRNQSNTNRPKTHQKTTPEIFVPPSPAMQSPNPKAMACRSKEKATNPGLDPKSSEVREVHKANFEEQLREIDREMGFLNENLDVLHVAENLSPPRGTKSDINMLVVNSLNDQNRTPLQDICNAHTTKVFKPGSGSWKKKARAKGNGPGALSSPVAEKRNCEAMVIDSDAEITSRPEKIPCVSSMEILSVTAGPQPRRDQ